jgi:polyhydroxyalkanoate synthase subunit PhaC
MTSNSSTPDSDTNASSEAAAGVTDWTENLNQASQQMFRTVMEKHTEMLTGGSMDPFNIGNTYYEAMMSLWKNPAAAIDAQKQYFADSLKLWQYTTTRLMGGAEGEDTQNPVIEPQKGDNRWRDEDWSQNVVFDYIKQSYLLSARCIEDTMDGVDDLPEKDQKRLSFFTKQFIDAMAPTNYPTTNPEVVRATLENRGENLVSGLQNFVRDMEEGDGQLRIAMTDPDAFTLGENVATTAGKVVFQNRMFQLIQYSPSTEEVLKRPLLIVPPWINKFYILDLQEKNSMIKWLVDQGHTVFIVSWFNPTEEDEQDIGFEDYMLDGIYTAMDAVEQATGESDINIVGYCIGGTLLASTLAHMAEKGDERIKSATFFTALIDFSDAGDLSVFIDDAQIGQLEDSMGEKGFLNGKSMSSAFNMLRSNDLIWSFYINNYLLGKDPTVFDLLYWNSDSTNMPAKMHSFYLRNMYLENKLCVPGGVTLDDVAIDVSRIQVPSYFISAKEDHIAPWKSTYDGAKLLNGKVRFVLGGSGHIAGIVNPPIKNKYGYWVGPQNLPENADDWFEKAKQHEGSWWGDWHNWLSKQDSVKVAARQPGDGKLKAIEDAPGTYVTKRV